MCVCVYVCVCLPLFLRGGPIIMGQLQNFLADLISLHWYMKACIKMALYLTDLYMYTTLHVGLHRDTCRPFH